MTRRRPSLPLPLGLAAGAFALALAQRPGLASADTKIDLHVDPARFLAAVGSVWSPTGDLGHVQGGQYGGYLFPMGSFYALGHALGLAPWLVQRLWLGAVLALAAWGVVRLLDALLGTPRGAAHLVAGAFTLLNPYVVVFTARTSVTLLGYAALPWLLLAVHRGLRAPRGWWWPAAFALLVTATGGGVNAAVTAWVLLGPVALVLYEPALGHVPWRAARDLVLRAGALTLLASLWWIAPVLAQARYGLDFLPFTEQPGTIWGTTSVTESLRLMGYWISYLGVGYEGPPRPYFGDGGVLLFHPLVVTASLLVPALALGGFAWTRRRRYVPFFALLVLLGVLVMVAGFPEATPLRRALTFGYDHVPGVRFLRTTYKAGPLVALGLAVLGGAAAHEAWSRLAARPAGVRRRAAAVLGGLALAGLLALSAWPLVRGRALDAQLTWSRIPSAWSAVARDLDAGLGDDARAVVLPGQPFAYYRWGGTFDPILPALMRRPVAVRSVPPYADLHAVDLLWTVDALLSQRRLLPGQLGLLVGLLGARAVVTGSDDDVARSGAPPPAAVAGTLAGQAGFTRPSRAYGPVRARPAAPGDLGGPAPLPEVRRYDVPRFRPLVRVEPLGPETVLDGSAAALAGLAAFGALPPRAPVTYAGDRRPDELRAAAAGGGEIVVSDANRRRVFAASRPFQSAGATLGAGDPLPADAALLDPFTARGASAQTVAVLLGARYLRAPFSPAFAQFPEHRPLAALDGDPATSWLGDAHLESARRWLEVGFSAPRDVPSIDVLPDDSRAVVTALTVAGREFRVGRGWTRLGLGLRSVASLRVRLSGLRQPPRGEGAGGGLRELRIPGLHVSEALRPPVLAERALAGTDLRRTGLTYLLERTTGDDPFRRSRYVGPAQAGRLADRGDAETGLARVVSPPAARTWRADAWVSVDPTASDAALDRLASGRDPRTFTSSSRFQGQPRYRASGAFDGTRTRAWIGTWLSGAPAWVAWRSPRPLAVRRLRLVPPRARVRTPVRVRLAVGRDRTPPLAVGPGGEVVLRHPLRGRAFRLDVLAARFSPGTPARERVVRAVGIGELELPGAERTHVRAGGALHGRCGAVAVRFGPGRLRLRPEGRVADLDAGVPLRARPCGAPLALPAGRQTLRSLPGTFRLAWLRVRSPAPLPRPPAPPSGGRVTALGDPGRTHWDGIRVALRGPSWLVLGQSYDRGWRARCAGRSLGAPQVIDGFANGWHAPATCRRVAFSFAPQTPIGWAYGLSGLACLLMGAYLVLARRRRRVSATPLDPPEAPAPVPRWPWRRAAAAGLAAAGVLGFVFALRAGALIGPAVFLVLWRGVGPRALALAAGGLLALPVPALYVLLTPRDKGGFNSEYPVKLIAAHWVGVAALLCFAAALTRTLTAARRGGQRSRRTPVCR